MNWKYLAATIIFGFFIAFVFTLSVILAMVKLQLILILTLLVIFSFLLYKRIKHLSAMVATTFILLGISGLIVLPLFILGAFFRFFSPHIAFSIFAILAFIGIAFFVGIIFLIAGMLIYFLAKKKIRKRKHKRQRTYLSFL